MGRRAAQKRPLEDRHEFDLHMDAYEALAELILRRSFPAARRLYRHFYRFNTRFQAAPYPSEAEMSRMLRRWLRHTLSIASSTLLSPPRGSGKRRRT